MNEESKRLASILHYLDELKEVLSQRPMMLGTPYEVNSMFFYLDAVEMLAKGLDGNSFYDFSWNEFLVQKKLIVGARNILRENLKKSDSDYSELQSLRKEFFLWREKKTGI